MFDPLGLQKTPDPSEPPAPVERRSWLPRSQPAVWLALLAVDALLVVLFGATVVAKIARHWVPKPAPIAEKGRPKQAPEPAPETPAETAKGPEADKAAETAKPPEPVKPAEPARAAEPAKPAQAKAAPKAATAKAADPKTAASKPAAAKPLPKPSLVSNGAAKPADRPAPRPAAPAAPAGKVRAKAVEFSVQAPAAKSVHVAGAFIVKGGKAEMNKGADGRWTATLYLHPGEYRYVFLIDGRRTIDPQNSRVSRGASVLIVEPR